MTNEQIASYRRALWIDCLAFLRETHRKRNAKIDHSTRLFVGAPQRIYLTFPFPRFDFKRWPKSDFKALAYKSFPADGLEHEDKDVRIATLQRLLGKPLFADRLWRAR